MKQPAGPLQLKSFVSTEPIAPLEQGNYNHYHSKEHNPSPNDAAVPSDDKATCQHTMVAACTIVSMMSHAMPAAAMQG
jgi:hypothetical protein